MNHKNQWNSFFAIEQQIHYSRHMQETIKLAHSANAMHTARCHIPLRTMVAKQVKFFALKIWLFQGLVLAALCALLFQLYSINAAYGIDAFTWAKHSLPKSLCLCSVTVVICAIPLLSRPTRYKMAELEQSTYFSVRGNLLAQLLFIGTGDIGMLSVLVLLAIRLQIAGDTIFLSLIIPFLTAAASGLMLWIRTSPSFFHKAGAILCGLSALFVYKITDNSMLFLPDTAFYVWILYALICIAVLYRECKKLYCRGIFDMLLTE